MTPENVYKLKKIEIFYIFLPSILILSVLSSVGLFYDAIRLAFLFMPGSWLYLKWLKNRSATYFVLSQLWTLIFSIDLALRFFSWRMYESDLDSVFIIEAITNTSTTEVIEFFSHNKAIIPVFIVSCIILNVIYLIPFIKNKNIIFKHNLFNKIIANVLILITITAYAIEPSRKLFPPIFWHGYKNEITAFSESIKNTALIFESWDSNAKKEEITYTGPSNQTMAIVIGESITSKNFGLCGYERNTTPMLELYKDDFILFCNALSPAASTVPSLRMKLTDESINDPNGKNLGSIFSRAKAAGYKTYWISNQDDAYTSATFGNYADESYYLNNRAGRTSISKDEVLIQSFNEALSDDNPLKLIVILTIGAHPNYNMRYTSAFDHFNESTNDEIEKKLYDKNINYTTIMQRNNYDNAIRYHDFVVSSLLKSFIENNPSDAKTFIYTSDHGNEVGHYRNFSGHSPKSKAGYAIPTFIWSNKENHHPNINNEVIVTDTLDITSTKKMDISWETFEESNYWFSKKYKPPINYIKDNFTIN